MSSYIAFLFTFATNIIAYILNILILVFYGIGYFLSIFNILYMYCKIWYDEEF
jgi:hypothetical protein